MNNPVNIVQGLQDIKTRVEGGKYNDEFAFETDIAALQAKHTMGILLLRAWHSMERLGGVEAVKLL